MQGREEKERSIPLQKNSESRSKKQSHPNELLKIEEKESFVGV